MKWGLGFKGLRALGSPRVFIFLMSLPELTIGFRVQGLGFRGLRVKGFGVLGLRV